MENISSVNDTHWDVGKQRADVIRPLAEQRKCPRESINLLLVFRLFREHFYRQFLNFWVKLQKRGKCELEWYFN